MLSFSPKGLSISIKVQFKNLILRINFQGISINLQLRRHDPEEPFISPYSLLDESGFYWITHELFPWQLILAFLGVVTVVTTLAAFLFSSLVRRPWCRLLSSTCRNVLFPRDAAVHYSLCIITHASRFILQLFLIYWFSLQLTQKPCLSCVFVANYHPVQLRTTFYTTSIISI